LSNSSIIPILPNYSFYFLPQSLLQKIKNLSLEENLKAPNRQDNFSFT